MRRSITAGFDCNVGDSFGDVLDKLCTALKRFDIEIYVTTNNDGETFSVDLYKFTDDVDVSFKKPPIDDITIEKIFLEYLASYDTLKTKGDNG